MGKEVAAATDSGPDPESELQPLLAPHCLTHPLPVSACLPTPSATTFAPLPVLPHPATTYPLATALPPGLALAYGTEHMAAVAQNQPCSNQLRLWLELPLLHGWAGVGPESGQSWKKDGNGR